MRSSDQLSLSDLTTDPDARTATLAGLEEADRLISDLAALVEAGLIEIHEHVLGPARYGAVGLREGPHSLARHPPHAFA